MRACARTDGGGGIGSGGNGNGDGNDEASTLLMPHQPHGPIRPAADGAEASMTASYSEGARTVHACRCAA